jgi:hypothetical protein
MREGGCARTHAHPNMDRALTACSCWLLFQERIQRLHSSRTSRLWALPPTGTSLSDTTGMSTSTASCCPAGLPDGPVTAVRLVFSGEVDVALLK